MADPMTKERIAELRALADAATPRFIFAGKGAHLAIYLASDDLDIDGCRISVCESNAALRGGFYARVPVRKVRSGD